MPCSLIECQEGRMSSVVGSTKLYKIPCGW